MNSLPPKAGTANLRKARPDPVIPESAVEMLALLAVNAQVTAEALRECLTDLANAIRPFGALLDERTVRAMVTSMGDTIAADVGRKLRDAATPLPLHTWQGKLVMAVCETYMSHKGVSPEELVNMSAEEFKAFTRPMRRAMLRLIGIKANRKKKKGETPESIARDAANAAAKLLRDGLTPKLVEMLTGEFEQVLLDLLAAQAKAKINEPAPV
jgi:hypothetical protein